MELSFPGGSDGKELACRARDLGLISGSGRSPGGGNGNPFQYSSLENPMDRGAWWAAVYGSQSIGHNSATSLSLMSFSCIPFEILFHYTLS